MKYLLLVFLLIPASAKTQTNKSFNWLIGNWKVKKNKGFIIETWKKQNDSLYIGFSGYVQAKDTIPEESIELKKIGANWFYIPTTLNQNEGNPILFKIILNKNKEFIAENKEHNFPQKICYRLFNRNLLASIEGNLIGVYKKVNYDYTKEE